MSALGFDSSFLNSAEPAQRLYIVNRPSQADDLQPQPEELVDGGEVTSSFAINSLHQIAGQVATGETLDDTLATALTLIKTLVNSDSCIAYVLQAGKFEPWVWQTRETGRDSAPSLSQEVRESLAEHRVPIALSRDLARDHRVRVFEQWLRNPGETFISVPLLSRKRLVGAINFRHPARVYNEWEVKLLSTVGYIIGADVGISLAEAENAALREDLETRKLIERGKGLLQRDLRVSEQQACLILEHLSRHRRKPAKEIAKAIILADEVKRDAVSG